MDIEKEETSKTYLEKIFHNVLQKQKTVAWEKAVVEEVNAVISQTKIIVWKMR